MSNVMVENGIHSDYRSPLATRYVSKEMRYNFSDQQKFSTWRKLWIYLAKAEMFEECGTCDESGNVTIKKVFLMSSKPRKSSGRSKSKQTDKRSTPNDTLKSPAPKISPNCSPNNTLEQCQLEFLTWQNNVLMYHLNRTNENVVQLLDANGNMKTVLDQYLLYENMKKNGAQPSMIFPSISSFLRKRKDPRTQKQHEAQKYTDETSASGQIVVDNPPDASFMNNYAINCQHLSRVENFVPENRNPNWNSANHLMPKVSRVLLTSEENQQQIILANNFGSVANVPANHALVHPNQYSFANHVQYGNYYQDYTVGGLEQNEPITSGQLIIEIPDQCNGYDARPPVYQQHSNVNWGYPYSISNQEYENRSFPEPHNGIYYQTNEPYNAREIAYCDNEISRGSISSSMQNFDDPYTYKAPGKSPMFENDVIFRGNQQSNWERQVDEKCVRRPILKANNVDVNVNY